MTRTDCDIIFAKSKEKGKRKINFKQFEAALGHVAARMGITVEQVISKVMNCQGPNFKGTKVGGCMEVMEG